MAATAELTIILKSMDQASAGIRQSREEIKQHTSAVEESTQAHGLFGNTLANVSAQFVVVNEAFRRGKEIIMAVADVMIDVSKEAAEDERAIAQMERSLKAQGFASQGATEGLRQFAEQMQATTTFSNTQYLRAMQGALDMGVKFGDVQKVTAAAADLATAKNMDLETAVTLLSKAYNGHTETLQRYGIFIGDNVSQGNKFQAVMDAIGKTMGGAARIDTENYIGAVKQLTNAWADFKKSIGEWLKPWMMEIVEITKGLIWGLQGWVTALSGVAPGYITASQAATRAHELLTEQHHAQQAATNVTIEVEMDRWRKNNEGALKYYHAQFALYEEDEKLSAKHYQDIAKHTEAFLAVERTAKKKEFEAEKQERIAIGDLAISIGELSGNIALKGAAIVIKAATTAINAVLTAANPILGMLGLVTSFVNAAISLQQIDAASLELHNMAKERTNLGEMAASGTDTGSSSGGGLPAAATDSLRGGKPYMIRETENRPGRWGGTENVATGNVTVVMNNGIFTGTEEEAMKAFNAAMREWKSRQGATSFA